MRWAEAVKIWNQHKKSVNAAHVYCLPRKGTPEHAHVTHIQKGGHPEEFGKEPKRFTKHLEHKKKVEEVAAKIKRSAAARRIAKALKAHAAKKDIITEGDFTDIVEYDDTEDKKAKVAKAIAAYAAKKRAKKMLPAKRFAYKKPDAPLFPMTLSDEDANYLMKKEFKYVSPDDDSLFIYWKDEHSPERIRDALIPVFKRLFKKPKLTKEELVKLMPYERTYLYYNPRTKTIRADEGSRLY
jgi:hypothetical protein